MIQRIYRSIAIQIAAAAATITDMSIIMHTTDMNTDMVKIAAAAVTAMDMRKLKTNVAAATNIITNTTDMNTDMMKIVVAAGTSIIMNTADMNIMFRGILMIVSVSGAIRMRNTAMSAAKVWKIVPAGCRMLIASNGSIL